MQYSSALEQWIEAKWRTKAWQCKTDTSNGEQVQVIFNWQWGQVLLSCPETWFTQARVSQVQLFFVWIKHKNDNSVSLAWRQTHSLKRQCRHKAHSRKPTPNNLHSTWTGSSQWFPITSRTFARLATHRIQIHKNRSESLSLLLSNCLYLTHYFFSQKSCS